MRWRTTPAHPRRARRPHGELRERQGGELRDREPLKPGEFHDRRHEFLHVYTQTVDGRFYVELLQRIGNYDDYGAPNTHIRLAAQGAERRRNT